MVDIFKLKDLIFDIKTMQNKMNFELILNFFLV